MAEVLITGGTGLIGKRLSRILHEKGYKVSILSRTRGNDIEIGTYTWNLQKNEIEDEAIDKADYIIHLAGADIGSKRWTMKRKQLIFDSRIKTGEMILSKIKKHKKTLKAFISASAIGYYGSITSDRVFIETDMSADDFLGQTCSQWEKMTDGFIELGIRTVKIRTGVVLTKHGGALSKMMVPIKMGIGSAIGNGKQYIPWIHIEDLCGIYVKAIEDTQMTGAYNACAPEHITNKEFTQTLAGTLKKTLWFPNIPAIVMLLLFGKMSAILLKGSRVSSDKIVDAGHSFMYPNLECALKQLFQQERY
jgi:uncharacterized protein (TIGR01777 family)